MNKELLNEMVRSVLLEYENPKLSEVLVRLINDMIDNKIIKRTIRIKDESVQQRFLKDLQPAIKDKTITVATNPIDKTEVWIRLHPNVKLF